MIYQLLRYLKGYLKIIISGDSVERFINICRTQNIQLWGFIPRKHCYEMCLSIQDFRKTRAIRRKTHIHMNIIEKRGFPFFLHSFFQRKYFILGMFFFCCILYYCCNTIWSIKFTGNQFYSEETLQKYLKGQQIFIGMNRNNVKCEEIVRQLRSQYNEIVWVSASLNSTQINIQIKENSSENVKNVTSEIANNLPTDILASKSGTIYKLITREGIPIVHEKDHVIPGQILISGIVPIKNDSDEIISYQNVAADADVYAFTEYHYIDTLQNTYYKKEYNSSYNYQFHIRYQNFLLIFHPISSDKNQEMFSSYHIIKPLQNSLVPLSYGIKKVISYKYKKQKYTKKEIQDILSTHFQIFCEDLEKKGVQITSNSVKINLGVSASKAEGTITAIEKIGISKSSQVTEIQNERINTE